MEARSESLVIRIRRLAKHAAQDPRAFARNSPVARTLGWAGAALISAHLALSHSENLAASRWEKANPPLLAQWDQQFLKAGFRRSVHSPPPRHDSEGVRVAGDLSWIFVSPGWCYVRAAARACQTYSPDSLALGSDWEAFRSLQARLARETASLESKDGRPERKSHDLKELLY